MVLVAHVTPSKLSNGEIVAHVHLSAFSTCRHVTIEVNTFKCYVQQLKNLVGETMVQLFGLIII